MGGGSASSSRNGLHPGDQFDCKLCGQRSVAALHSGILECSQCLFQIQEYDTVMHDRVPLDDEGRISGRGPVQRPGGIQGSVISSKGDSASSRRWKRLSLIDRRGRKGPTRSKIQTIELIRKLAATTTHLQIALDLLELGWPDSGSGGSSIASENPMWRPAQ